jgi:hypothetical protein
VYAALHFDAFVGDIKHQLEWKSVQSTLEGGLWIRVSHPFVIAAVALLGLSIWVLRKDRGARPLFFLTGALVVQMALTVGWLYELYSIFGLMLVAVLTVEAAVHLAASRSSPARPWAWAERTFAAVVAAVLFAWLVFPDPYLARSFTSATVIRYPFTPRYITPEDRSAVERYLRAIDRGKRRLVVQFLPEADALFFAHARSPTLGLLQQTHYEGTADIYIYHDSVWLTPFVRETNALRVGLQQGVATPIPLWPVLQRRDSTEIWRVYRRPESL